MTEFARSLQKLRQGDRLAAEELLPLVYAELRRLAARRLAVEKPGQTLDATALVHEAYLRLAGGATPQQWDGRGHFFAAAAEAMRRILIERARRRKTYKHGGGRSQVDLSVACSLAETGPSVDVLALDEALTRLADESPAKANVVKLRYFAGLTSRETADALGISVATAERHWTYARSWLFAALREQDELPACAEESSDSPAGNGA